MDEPIFRGSNILTMISFNCNIRSLDNKDQWAVPKIISKGDNWFINWADFPSINVYEGGEISAHWLQMRDTGTYQYDIHISQSLDGDNWNPSFIPHRDSLAAEHGFVSIAPHGPNKMVATWLDGRNTVSENKEPSHGHGHGGSMTLRTATFDTSGNLEGEYELDTRICDCCQTDIAVAKNGPVIVYRDRTDDEIRDISIIRNVDGIWLRPNSVHNDEWFITGCPVNGPAVDAHEENIVVAWYTAADGKPAVNLSFSYDGGTNFDLPVRIDDGNPIGRVDVTFYSSDVAIVTWIESSDENTWIKARYVKIDGTSSESYPLTQIDPGRRSGFPILQKDNSGMLLSWSHIDQNISTIKTARILRDRS